jgi:ketosteroid isomerase-like protein
MNKEMENITDFFEKVYLDFNSRQIDAVIANMTEDVKWANGMDGGYVYGTDEVKEYWTRQFTMVSSNVTPLKIDADKGIVKIKVHQVVHDLNGNLLADELVYHLFHLKDNKIAVFDIGEKIKD